VRSLEQFENLWDAALVDALHVIKVPRLAVPLLRLPDALAARLAPVWREISAVVVVVVVESTVRMETKA